tara:strand:- start:1429 stop:1980 length:552 start_codon:yes stop_codon:yes gene_type:complete
MRGADKLLETIDGMTQLYRIAKAAAENGDTYITLPFRDHPREAVLASMSITKIYLDDKNTGMGSSIAEGVKNIQSEDANVTGIIIIPADMPLIDYNAIQAFFTAHPKFPQSIIQAVDDNGPGHPVLFPRKYFKDLILLEKETGGRGIIKKSENTKVLKFRGSIATLDLDTPEDWETWRNGRAN